MNKLFSRLSIQYKLFSITIFSSVLSMLLALTILLTINITDIEHKAMEELKAVADLIANRSIAAVMFDDTNLAKENLGSLNSLPNLLNACVYNSKGYIFTTRDNDVTTCPATTEGLSNHTEQLVVYVFQPMQKDDDFVGSVYLASDLSAALWHELKFIGLVVVVLLIAFFITFLLTAPLLSSVAKPIALLAKTAHSISHDQDYSLRAVKQSDDELGILVDAFNGMLNTVETQNKALIAAKNSYQALYDNNPTMVFNLDLQGAIVSVNRFGAKQLGTSADQLQHSSIFTFVHPEDITTTEQFFHLCQKHPEQVYKQESRLICHDERILWVRETARLVSAESSQHLLLVCEDITETRRLTEKIAYQASHDELTGLVNRRQFDIYIQKLVAQAQVDNSHHVLCYLDLDQFKVVNDTGGHLAGDELLRQLGELLRHNVRKIDVLARLGGDEFGILMTHCTLDQALVAGEKLRNAIRDFQFAWENRSFGVGVSIGIAAINRSSGNAVDILKEADAACYAAKDKGRNRVHVFSSNDEELALRQGEMQWVEKIRLGIEHNRFHLYGQLITPVAEGHQEGLHFETLIRYQDDHGKMIPPGAFLPAAERYNIAPELDRWVIAQLFKHIHSSAGFIDRLETCSVNLSGLSLSDETMLEFIDQQFSQWQIPTHKICFEITETAAISSLSYAKHFIDALRKKGCLFSLDDFGSGLSSFGYLKNLPVDFLKIDGLFVKDILDDEVDLTMVKSINEVGHVMGKKTIAEFVENQDILNLLRSLGVDYAQGYGVAKPVPLREL